MPGEAAGPGAGDQPSVRLLLDTSSLTVRDILCPGRCRHGPAECASGTHLAFCYRGSFVRQTGRAEAMGAAGRLIFFNHGEEYRIGHPIEGGDACLSLHLAEPVLRELARADQLEHGVALRFRRQDKGVDPGTQALAALLRHRLASGRAAPMEAESVALALVARALGEDSSHAGSAASGLRKIVDRAKSVLMSDPGRRWTLGEVGREVGVSPVYLTQLFRRVEGVPLYRYHLRLRLARALDLLDRYEDLTALGLDLGFSSHSHFTAAFRRTFGESPRAFQRSAGLR